MQKPTHVIKLDKRVADHNGHQCLLEESSGAYVKVLCTDCNFRMTLSPHEVEEIVGPEYRAQRYTHYVCTAYCTELRIVSDDLAHRHTLETGHRVLAVTEITRVESTD